MKDSTINRYLDKMVILHDTREQKNQHILSYLDHHNVKHERIKLQYADYSCKIPIYLDNLFIPMFGGKNKELLTYIYEKNKNDYITFENIISIERKANLNELVGNLMGTERERLHREFERSKGQVHLLIEGTNYSDIPKHNYKSAFPPPSLLGSIKSFEAKYNLRTCYLDNKNLSGQFIYHTLLQAVKHHLRALDKPLHEIILGNLI